MSEMLYTKDGQLALDVDDVPMKGVFDRKKVACFYHVFDDEDVEAAKVKGWVTFEQLLSPEKPAESEKKPTAKPKVRRGRPPKAKVPEPESEVETPEQPANVDSD